MAAFLLTLLRLSILGSVLTGLLLLVRPLIRSRAAAYYLWLLVLVRLCLPWGVTLPLPVLPEQTAYQAHTQTAFPLNDQTDPVQLQGQAGESADPAAPEQPGAPEPAAGPSMDWRGLITSPALWFGLWAAGTLLWLGRYVWGYRRFAALVRASAHPAGEAAQRVLADLDPGGRAALLECPHVSTPMLLGVIHPAIVLPEGVETHRLADILSHELTHARRHDLLYKWLAAAVTSLHWFNPLMAAVRRELSRDCELSCDAAVVREMDAPARRHYGETLLALAAGQSPRGAGLLTVTLCEEKEHLKERLVAVMKVKRPGPAALVATLALAVLLTSCAVIGGAAPSPTPASAPTSDALLADPVLRELDYGLELALPGDLADQLLLLEPEEGEGALLSVYERRSYEADPGLDMGLLFTLVRCDQLQYEEHLVYGGGVGAETFARGDGCYYLWYTPTDVRFASDTQDEAAAEAEYRAWEELTRRLPGEIQADFIARNGLEPYDDSMSYHDGCLWEGEHVYIRYDSFYGSQSVTLLLSQPADQGEHGIWCVEGWMDNDDGIRYSQLPTDSGLPAAEYYAWLQDQADQGHRVGLLDPLQVAMEWLTEQYGADAARGQTELLEGDPAWAAWDQEIFPLLVKPGTLTQVRYREGRPEELGYCGSPGLQVIGYTAWVHAQAPEALEGDALVLECYNGGRLLVLEEGGLVGVETETGVRWYSFARPAGQAGDAYTVFLASYQGLSRLGDELPAGFGRTAAEVEQIRQEVSPLFAAACPGCDREELTYDPLRAGELASELLGTDDPEQLAHAIVFSAQLTTGETPPEGLEANTAYYDCPVLFTRTDAGSPWSLTRLGSGGGA